MYKLRIAGEALNGRSGHDVGRTLLARMYREETGTDCPDIRIGSRGKPYFAEGTWHFSVTHTSRRVFCALCDKPVGIDAEEKDRRISSDLAKKVLSPAEKARYAAAPDCHAALLRLWVLKEAAVKCSGDGLRGYPNRTDFSPDDPRVWERDGCYLAVIIGDEGV